MCNLMEFQPNTNHNPGYQQFIAFLLHRYLFVTGNWIGCIHTGIQSNACADEWEDLYLANYNAIVTS